MKVLIIGNLGYVGPLVVDRLRKNHPQYFLAGFDIGYFEHILTTSKKSPETNLDVQYYGDVRKVDPELLNGVDSVIYLAAISNDPMGQEFESITHAVNHRSAVSIAKIAKAKGANNFVFASSCSIYGFSEDSPRTETSGLNPLTAYAKSKINTENDLESIADSKFRVICLRFATACGFSSRLRLDLVLNDFVASAITNKKIEILSDGTPWRPLIHVKDMARAIDWAVTSSEKVKKDFISVNVGSNEWNYQIKKLAEGVQRVIPDVEISINKDAVPDKRSYKVDFSLFKEHAPDYCPSVSLEDAIKDLVQGLNEIGFNDSDFRNSNLLRLNVLKKHVESNLLDENLEWI